jgi:alkylated DNA repair dioxygenase AlkB
MAVALRVLVQRQPGFRLDSRRHLRLARLELDWLQQADSTLPVTRPAMRPPHQEMSMQRANSLALEEARPQAREKQSKAQVKVPAPLWPVNLPGQASRLAQEKPIRLEPAQAKCPG